MAIKVNLTVLVVRQHSPFQLLACLSLDRVFLLMQERIMCFFIGSLQDELDTNPRISNINGRVQEKVGTPYSKGLPMMR